MVAAVVVVVDEVGEDLLQLAAEIMLSQGLPPVKAHSFGGPS